MPAGLRVADAGRESGLGGCSPPGAGGRRSGTDGRWWQWPEEGPVTTRGRGMRKEGPAEGVAGAGAGGRLRGPAVGVGDRPPRVLAEAAWAAAASRAGTAAWSPRCGRLGCAGKGSQEGADSGVCPVRKGSEVKMLSRAGRAPRGWHVWLRGQEGQRRRTARCAGMGPRAAGGAGRSRRAGAALRRLPLLHLHMGRRPGRSQGLNDSFGGDPAPGPPGPAPGRCVAHARPPVSSPVSLPRSSPSAPRPPENAAHSVPSPSARTRECRLGLRSAP